MQDDYKPILFNAPKDAPYIDVYFIHDIHYGSDMFESRRWNALKREIAENPLAYILWIGDCLEYATPNSKSDVFYQRVPPHEQKMWLRDQFIDLEGKTIAVIPGNHERNRSTKTCGMFPLYDACVMAGIESAYRPHFALVDIGVGTRERSGKSKPQQNRYFGYIVHKASNQVKFGMPDTIDGIDFFAYGHDHDPKSHPRGKLVYDPTRKELREKTVRVINSGSFLKYGGYGSDEGYRPNAGVRYTLHLSGQEKRMRGFEDDM